MTTNLQTNNCILLLCFAVFCCLKLDEIMSKETVKPLKTQRLQWFHRLVGERRLELPASWSRMFGRKSQVPSNAHGESRLAPVFSRVFGL